MTGKPLYTVRKQSSGYSFSETYYVWKTARDGRPAGRVSVHANSSRNGAQAEADALNITSMVRPFDEDPRPYAERRAEAEVTFYANWESR